MYTLIINYYKQFLLGVNKKFLKNNQSLGHLIWQGWALLGWHLAHLSVQKLFASVICNEHFWVLGGALLQSLLVAACPADHFCGWRPKSILTWNGRFFLLSFFHFFVAHPEQKKNPNSDMFWKDLNMFNKNKSTKIPTFPPQPNSFLHQFLVLRVFFFRKKKLTQNLRQNWPRWILFCF